MQVLCNASFVLLKNKTVISLCCILAHWWKYGWLVAIKTLLAILSAESDFSLKGRKTKSYKWREMFDGLKWKTFTILNYCTVKCFPATALKKKKPTFVFQCVLHSSFSSGQPAFCQMGHYLIRFHRNKCLPWPIWDTKRIF